MEPVYKRIMLKISGEVLAGQKGFGFDHDIMSDICTAVAECAKSGVQTGVVVGGGNFWRGRSSGDMERTRADSIGMLATVMNSIALCDNFERLGLGCKVMSAVDMPKFAELFSRDRAVEYLESGKIVIFGCGTGNPFFSTDSAAALRAVEIGADVYFKATNVDGVYDKDPNKFPDAVKYDKLTHGELLQKRLGVMDATAAALCMDNALKVLIFNLDDTQNIIRAVNGENIGTLVI